MSTPLLTREPTKLDQLGLGRFQSKAELTQPETQDVQYAQSVRSVLETNHKSSSGEESHPSALTDPDRTLSRHPALTPRPPV